MDCFSFPKSKISYYSNFDIKSCNEWLYSFGNDCSCKLSVDSFHKFRVFFLFVSESVWVNIDTFLFGVFKNLVFVNFE